MTPRPLPQKTIGLLGGSSNIATMEYYRFLNDGVNTRLGGWEIAETLIAGMNFGNIEAMVRADDWDGLSTYMRTKAQALVAGGADVILCVSNTLHRPLAAIAPDLPVPILHIGDPTGQAIKDAGLQRVALFGTQPIMRLDYMKHHWRDNFGLEIVTPTPDEQHEIDRIIFDELVKGDIRDASRQRYVAIANRLRADEMAQGLILGCTEIFLLLDQPDIPDFPMFNTARLHCDAAVDLALRDIK